MIIYEADKMGLSQLYQLRGRVGRSNKVAYSYFTYKKDKNKWRALAKEYEKEIMKYHPDAIEFMKGIAEGAALPYIDILTLNIAT